jgi:hypothetical protein
MYSGTQHDDPYKGFLIVACGLSSPWYSHVGVICIRLKRRRKLLAPTDSFHSFQFGLKYGTLLIDNSIGRAGRISRCVSMAIATAYLPLSRYSSIPCLSAPSVECSFKC